MTSKHSALDRSVIESVLSSLDCPRSLTVWLLFDNLEHDQLSQLSIEPIWFNTKKDFRDAYLATKLLSKADFLSTSFDKKSVALNSFRDAEEACATINHRGYHWTKVFRQGPGVEFHNRVQRKIAYTLGDFEAEEWIDSCNWGPGVTLKTKRDTSSVNKFGSENQTTRPLDNLIGDFYAIAYPTWDLSERTIVSGNKIVTVPKNSKTDRTIAIEPGLNSWFQKGIGKMIRRRLLRQGVNLNDQSINQQASKFASVNGELATVDFSSASDTIAYSTVKELLPERWFNIMDIARSAYGSLEGKQFKYEKFSSMGNGFTFELETLIFWAIACSACAEVGCPQYLVSVYGDDVIIPVDAFEVFVKASEFYGFTVNKAKSYSSTHFRESCGVHYWSGYNCKPLYIKEALKIGAKAPKGDLSIYLLANGIRRLAHDRQNTICDSRFLPSWRLLFKAAKRKLFVSEGYGDGGFSVNFDEAHPIRARNSLEGFFTLVVSASAVKYSTDRPSLLLSRLKDGSQEMALLNEVPLRGRVRYSRKRLFIHRWYNYGPWL